MDEKRITSIEISNSSSGPFCIDDIIAEKIIVYRSGKIKHSLYNGRSEKPVEVHEYKVSVSKTEEFFEFLVSKIKVQDWALDYSVIVCDGWTWECKIRHSDNTIKKIIGTVQSPPRGKQLSAKIIKLAEFEVKPWLF